LAKRIAAARRSEEDEEVLDEDDLEFDD